MIDANVYNYLKAESTIIAVTGQRIYNTILPAKTTYPAITFRATDHDIDNVFGGSTGFVRSDYYIDAWGANITAADSLATIIRNAMKDLTGSFGGITVQQIFITMGPLAVFEDSTEAFRVTQMFSIWHGEG
jgi:hypothetical protein